MTEPASTGPTPRPGAATSSTTPGMRWVLAAIAVVVLSLLFGIWGAWQLFAPGSDHPQRQLADQAAQIEQLQQQVATLSRSDQISRDANRDVQNTLAEMARRIASHRDRRGPSWQTVEEALDLPGVLARTQGVRLVDCLTLWLSNVMAAGDPEPAVAGLCAALARTPDPVVLVTNELGQGIVPENALARRFRDAHGLMNQSVAAVACEVWMAVSGLPLRLKPPREMP